MTPTEPMQADPTATGGTDPATVVRRFLTHLEALDVDAALALADDSILYHNKGLPAAHGKAEVERQLRALARYATVFEARIHHLAVDDGTVLTERTDVIGIRGFRTEFWVCGTFEVRDGRIVLWRDHFDFVNVAGKSLLGLGRLLARTVRDRAR